MTNLLIVTSSVSGEQSNSCQLARLYEDRWHTTRPGGSVNWRDLHRDITTHLDGPTVAAFFTPPDQLSEDQKQLTRLSDQLIDEFTSADEIVFAVPMYNFSIPSQLKTYFDLIARVGVTFRYTDTGPVGLLDDCPVLVIATRGGIYSQQNNDFQSPFIQQYLNFLGINSVRFVYAEGMNLGEPMAQAALRDAAGTIASL